MQWSPIKQAQRDCWMPVGLHCIKTSQPIKWQNLMKAFKWWREEIQTEDQEYRSPTGQQAICLPVLPHSTLEKLLHQRPAQLPCPLGMFPDTLSPCPSLTQWEHASRPSRNLSRGLWKILQFNYLFSEADLIACEEQHKQPVTEGLLALNQRWGPLYQRPRCVCKKAAGSKQESHRGEMTAIRVQPLPALSIWPLPKQKQCLNLCKHPQWQRGRV